MGVTAVVGTGVCVDDGRGVAVGGIAGFDVGDGGTGVYLDDGVEVGVRVVVGVAPGVPVAANRVLVFVGVTLGVRVGRVVTVGT